jgi:hypothetical protein
VSYDLSAYTGALSLAVGSLVSPISQAAGMGLVIFGGLVLLGVGVRWAKRLAHKGS